MQKLAMTVIAAALAFAVPAFAEHDHGPQKGREAKAGSAKPAALSAATVQNMQDNVKTMQTQLERIAKANTDEERQKATADYRQTMQENMKMAGGMPAMKMSCPMMEHGMGHGMDHGKMDKGGMGKMGGGMMGGGMGMMGDGAQSGGSAERMQQMEKRMDMMQLMLEQMVRRPEGQQPAPAK
jgi:hypothetical protein